MVDLFDEVDERLRSDQFGVLMRRYLPWVGGMLALALAIAFGVWGWRAYQTSNAHKASDAYAMGLDALGGNDQAGAFTAFGEAVKSPSAIYRSLALMQQAGIRLDQKHTPEAVALFDAAAKADPTPLLADAARLKSALALLDTASYAAVEARLVPLTQSNRPYAPVAREALAMAKLRAGDVKGARSDFVVISLLADTPDDMRERAKAAMDLIDSGGAGDIPAIVKTALTLPPPPPPPTADQQAAAAAQQQQPDPAGAAQ